MPASLSRPTSWPSSAAASRGRASNWPGVVAFLVHFARQFLDLLRLQGAASGAISPMRFR
jgi:hypothetical protein